MKKSMLFVVVFSNVFLSCLANAADSGSKLHDKGGYFEKFAEDKERACGDLSLALRMRRLPTPADREIEEDLTKRYIRCSENAGRKFHERHGTNPEGMLSLFAIEQCKNSDEKDFGPCVVRVCSRLSPFLNRKFMTISSEKQHVEHVEGLMLLDVFYQFRDREFRKKFNAKY